MPSHAQALLVVSYPLLITIQFDEAGNVVDIAEEPFPESLKVSVQEHGLSRAFRHGAESELLRYFQSIGLTQKPITVRQFFVPRYHIGIRDFPESFREALMDPSRYSAEEQSLAKEERERWLREGLMELWLNEDCYRWVDREGRVQAS
jgi:hypothetical protein